MYVSRTLLILATCLMADLCAAREYALPPEGSDLIGRIQKVQARQVDSLADIARTQGVGHLEIREANPGVDFWLPGEGAEVIIPSRHILPSAERRGIVLNLPEMRIYYYPKSASGSAPATVITHPVSIGRMDWQTPLGETRISSKVKNPTWTPPESIKEEWRADGRHLADVVPAGPDNPLGEYAMRLALPGYLIHGTNRPYGVGMRVTHGCVRMYPEDIEALFPQVEVGTRVVIINEPVKVGWWGDDLYMEVHPPLEEQDLGYEWLRSQALDHLEAATIDRPVHLSGRDFLRVLEEQSGMPVKISRPMARPSPRRESLGGLGSE